MLHLHYFYNTPSRSPAAALIQILHTLNAACDLGAKATLYLQNEEPADEFLEGFNLSPRYELTIEGFFSHRWWSNRVTLAHRLRDSAKRLSTHDRHVLLTRGEMGLSVIRRAADVWPGPRLLDVHRLCFQRLLEQRTGTMWTVEEKLHRRERRMRRYEDAAIQSADGLLVLTPAVEAALREQFNPSAPTLILPSGVDATQKTPLPADERCYDIIYAGKLETKKGVEVALRAMVHLPGRYLTVVGGTREETSRLRAMAKKLDISDRVQFAERANHRIAVNLVGRSKVGVCPLPANRSVVSRLYSSPMKILEMLAAGTLVVASDVLSVRQMVTHEQTALLVEPDDPQALAEAIERLNSDLPLATRLRDAGIELAKQHAWPVRARRLLDFLADFPDPSPQ